MAQNVWKPGRMRGPHLLWPVLVFPGPLLSFMREPFLPGWVPILKEGGIQTFYDLSAPKLDASDFDPSRVSQWGVPCLGESPEPGFGLICRGQSYLLPSEDTMRVSPRIPSDLVDDVRVGPRESRTRGPGSKASQPGLEREPGTGPSPRAVPCPFAGGSCGTCQKEDGYTQKKERDLKLSCYRKYMKKH